MIVIPGNAILYVDVDDTLIMWSPDENLLAMHGIEIECPGGMYPDEDGNMVPGPSWTAKVLPHRVHVSQIMKHKARGHTVVVWSAGGVQWAEAAVKALKLERYVDVVICKPTWAYDDMPPDRILPKIQWKEDK